MTYVRSDLNPQYHQDPVQDMDEPVLPGPWFPHLEDGSHVTPYKAVRKVDWDKQSSTGCGVL